MENYIDFINEYKNFNEKSKYYKIQRNGNIIISKPSYVFEIQFLKEKKIISNEYKIDFNEVINFKDKKINRHSNLKIDILEDRLFRLLINKDSNHALSYANELARRDRKKFLELIYLISKISNDQYMLIKCYFYEIITSEIGFNIYLLRNLINYITKSNPGYGNLKKVDKLYSSIYELKFNEKIDENIEMIEEHEIMFKYLKGGK